MKYTKPEVGVLGQAVQVIELVNPPKITGNVDGSAFIWVPNPAYDLDE
jgi:hypothetical protein